MTIMTRTARVLASAALLAGLALPAAAQTVFGPDVNTPTPALTAFQTALAALKDAKYDLHDVEKSTDGAKSETRTYKVDWIAPHSGDINVIAGDGVGGRALWKGGDKVVGHPGGGTNIKAIIPINDPRVTSLRGNQIDSAFFPYLLSVMLAYPGTVTEAPGATAGTTVVTNVFTKAAPHGETKGVLTLSNDTHLPTEFDAYEGDKEVVTATYSDLKTNNGLTAADLSAG